ncbi:MAG: diaminopimelate epimerase [Gammaproteobacteria bacterium]
MHGLGNDFVLFDALSNPVSLSATQIRAIADRRHGIGCDQVLLIEPAHSDQADVRYRIFNADGGEVGQCGNGARCITQYLRNRGYMRKDTLVAETTKGRVSMCFEPDGMIRVNMGAPKLNPEDVPVLAKRASIGYEIDIGGETIGFFALSMGNSHAVLGVEDVETAAVAQLGARLSRHACFPEGANVGFMQVLHRGRMRLRVYERGVGETLACGSGACAAVVAGRLMSRLDPEVAVELRGGILRVAWHGEGSPVWMAGPATYVFEGSIQL